MNMIRTLLGCSVLALAACGSDNPTPTPADSSTPTDATPSGDAPAGDGGAGSCYTEMGAAGGFCPTRRVMNDMTRPNYRVTHITIRQPTALTSPILSNVVNTAIHNGNFLWGLSFDLMANTFRTGPLNAQMITRGTVGRGLVDGQFRYYMDNAPAMGGAANRWNPVTGMTTMMGDRVAVTGVMGTVRLPIYDDAGALLTELPLESARMTGVQITADRGCIGLAPSSGTTFNECSSNWATSDSMMMPYGRLEAVITAAAARMVRVSALNTTLCNLLSGSDCDAMPMGSWTRQPDAMAGGMPGYTLVAEFSAISARIQ